ncbi:hypothetical protein D9M72_624780 [compost metagenome]
MLGTVEVSMVSPAWRILLIWFRANRPRASISAPIRAKPRSARGAIFMLRRDMVVSRRGKGTLSVRQIQDCHAYRSAGKRLERAKMKL